MDVKVSSTTLSLEIVGVDDVGVRCDLPAGNRLRGAVDIQRLAHRINSTQSEPMRHTARECYRTDMTNGVAIGRAVFDGAEARVQKLWVILVDDQVARE